MDDGSTDGMPELAEALSARHRDVRAVHPSRNLGFSAAWKTCVTESFGEWVFVGPADGQVRPDAPLDFYRSRGTSDVVVGVCRRTHESVRRRFLSGAFRMVARATLGLPFNDFSLCFIFRGDLVRSLHTLSRARTATILPELLFLAHRDHARIVEREIDVLQRRSGRAKGASPRLVLQTLLEFLRLAVAHRVLPALDLRSGR